MQTEKLMILLKEDTQKRESKANNLLTQALSIIETKEQSLIECLETIKEKRQFQFMPDIPSIMHKVKQTEFAFGDIEYGAWGACYPKIYTNGHNKIVEILYEINISNDDPKELILEHELCHLINTEILLINDVYIIEIYKNPHGDIFKDIYWHLTGEHCEEP